MKRLLSTVVIVSLGLAAVNLSACTPAGRYVDLVFASATTSTVTYKNTTDLTTGDPLALRLDVFQPTGDTQAARPVVVWIHGGGFRVGSRAAMGEVATGYARRGYVTASIDYRLDPGNRCQDLQDGKITDPHQAEIERARCQAAIEAAQADALDAIRWLRRRAATYRIDTTRVAVGGGSAGAVTALNVAERANPGGGPVAADVKVGAALAMSGCQYDPPAIDANDAPISLLASGRDGAVPFACVVATANRAQSVGTPVERLFYPTESAHAMALYRAHQADVDKAWTAFLIDHLHL